MGDLAGFIWLWDRPTGTLLARIPAHGARVSGLAFRDEEELISAGWDAALSRWPLRLLRQPPTAIREELGAWALSAEEALEAAR